MPDYNLLGSTEVLEELQEGRTRELLLLLQDKPVPEVIDPLNLQSGLSTKYKKSNGDYILREIAEETTDRPDDNKTVSVTSRNGVEINPNDNLDRIEGEISSNTSSNLSTLYLLDSSENIIQSKDISGKAAGDVVGFDEGLNSGTDYYFVADNDGSSFDVGVQESTNFPYTGTFVDITYAYDGGPQSYNIPVFTSITGVKNDPALSGNVTDRFASPTSEPADFKQWNAIQARDVTTGGSTSADPVEFEILDSTDTALNSSRIPKARIADEPFVMRNRVYSESAGSDGQSDYTVATTGDGGHFGIPVLTVVSVKKNGSVLESANWSFDGDTTVTIDTSSVTIASGDTIDIKYDFDVFDSTLQPRAFLSRESTSETSPSISHFRYEYVI